MNLCPECHRTYGPLDAICPDCGVELERPRAQRTATTVISGSDLSEERTTIVPILEERTTLGPAAASSPANGAPGVTIFQYTGRRADGEVVTGQVSAPTQAQAMAKLRADGLLISALRPVGRRPAESAPRANDDGLLGAIYSGVSLKAIAFFFRQLAALVRSGIALGESLHLLEAQTANRRLRAIAAETSNHCAAGGRMSEVFRRHPRVFPEAVIEMVSAGEEAGRLDRFLEQIADYLERLYQIASRIKGALTYPAFMLFAIIFIPSAPIWVMAGPAAYFSATLKWAFGIVATVVGTAVLFRVLLTSPRFALLYDQVKLSLPVIGKVVRQFALGKFGRTLAMLYVSGASMSRALTVAANTCGNRYLREKLLSAVPIVEKGGAVSEAIGRTGCFPPTTLHVIATGEKTGNIDQMVIKISEFAEADANTAVDQAVALILPISVIILGALVLMTLIQFYTGYFNNILSTD